jgi:isopentenyl-diphosphate delta-isomerase
VSDIKRRKADHIQIAARGEGDFDRKTTLLEQVHLIHQALPELDTASIDLGCELFGRRLDAPILITGMTGGTEEAAAINRDLAQAAAAANIAFGVGSQRAMALHPELASTYEVRSVAPDVLLLGNLGAVQARELGPNGVGELAAAIGADAMAIHLNPGQELIQEGGDRDFRGLFAAIAEIALELPIPVVVKETGCGISPRVADMLVEAQVAAIDVSGAGGTSWVAVEARRAAAGTEAEALGELLWDWGIPTAVSVVAARRAGARVIASGGLRSGYDAARALALGASIAGFAAPALRAQQAGGAGGVAAFLERLADTLRSICLLTGCRRVADLATAPRHLDPELVGWLHDLGLR